MLLFFSFSITGDARAADVSPDSVRIKLETQVNGKDDNLIRVLEGGARVPSAEFKVIITVLSASDSKGNPLQSINLGSDILDFNATGSFDRTISALGAGLEIAGEGNTCGTRNVTAIIGENKKFTDCDFSAGKKSVNFGNIVVGQPYEFALSISSASKGSLKLDRPCIRDAKTTACFAVYPYVLLDKIGRNANLAVTSAAKDIYVQFFNSQSELDKAIANNIRPNDIPGYGSNEGGLGTSNTGSGLLGFFNEIIGIIIGFISQLVYGLFFLLVAPLIEGILHIRTYTDSFAGVIYPGWEVLRNVSNIFFIVALIAIGLGTLFRIESYQFKHLLVQLMIAALMVNFSLVLGQAVLGIADTVQNQFMPDSRGVVRDLGKELIASYSPSVVYKLDYEANGYFANTVAPLFYLALSIGSFLVFAAVGAYLLIRIVALWVLLMISPLAYVAGILPSTSHYRTEWWTTFLKYAFFTPIMAFFLNMAAIMVNTYKNNSILQDVLDRPQDILGANSDVGAFFFKVSSNILILVFLIIALKVAEQAGIYGASTISNIAQKGIAAPFALTGKGAKALGGLVKRGITGKIAEKIGEHSLAGQLQEGRLNKAKNKIIAAEKRLREAENMEGGTPEKDEAKKAELEKAKKGLDAWASIATEAEEEKGRHGRWSAGWRVASFFDPKVVKEAWEKRSHEKEMRDYQPAIGHMQDTFNRIIPTENILNPKRWAQLRKGELGKKTYHGLIAKRGVVDTEASEMQKGVRTREDAARILERAFAAGDKDEIEAALKIVQTGNQQDDYMNLRGATYENISYLDHITERMKKDAGMSEEEILVILDDLKETAEADGKLRAYGYTREDGDGAIRAANDFGYYENMSEENQRKELLKLAKQHMGFYESNGNQRFKDIAEAFKKASSEVGKGKSFTEILKNTNYRKEDSEYVNEGDNNLANTLTARRFMDEAQIKLRRGQAVKHASGWEAALVNYQNAEEGWVGTSLFGEYFTNEAAPNIVESLTGRIHQSQGRLIQGHGAIQDEISGNWSLPDYDIAMQPSKKAHIEAWKMDHPGKEPDDATMETLSTEWTQHHQGWKKMITTAKLNNKLFSAITQSDRLFSQENRIKFMEKYNRFVDVYMKKHPGQHTELKKISIENFKDINVEVGNHIAKKVLGRELSPEEKGNGARSEGRSSTG